MCRLSAVRAAEAQLLDGRAGVRALSEKLSTAPLNEEYLDVAGPSSIKRYDVALLKWRPVDQTRLALRILSDRNDLPAAQDYNADRGADVREFWTDSESRGVAIVAGEKELWRVHTDGRIVCSLVLRSAAWVVAAAKVDLRTDVSNLSFGIRALHKLVAAGVLVQDADCKVRAGPKLLRLRLEIDEDLTAADVLSFWLDCAFVSGRTAAHCIPGCWAGVYHWMVTAWLLEDAAVRTEFGVVDRLAALDAFHAMPEYYSEHHIYFQNIVWNDGKVGVLDDLFRGVHDAVVVRFYDPSKGALAAPEYEFTRELVEAIRDGGSLERVRLSREHPTVRAFVKDWAQLSLKREVPAAGLRYKDRGDEWMLDEWAFADVFRADWKGTGRYNSTLMGGIRYALFTRNEKGELELALDKGRKPPVNASTISRAKAARDAACESDAVREAKRKYDAECAAWRQRAAETARSGGGHGGRPQTVVPPPTAATLATFALPAATAPQMPVPGLRERNDARAWRASFAPPPSPPRKYVKIDRATVVPPEPGVPRRFVNVSWDTRSGLWKAEYGFAKATRKVRNQRTLGYYPTDELAARARHKHIIREGLEQFNTMDVLDDATDLMVPRERKKPPKKKKRPPPATFDVVDGSESRSGRVRKATKR